MLACYVLISLTHSGKISNVLQKISELQIREEMDGTGLSVFFLFLFCLNLGPFGPFGPLRDREG